MTQVEFTLLSKAPPDTPDSPEVTGVQGPSWGAWTASRGISSSPVRPPICSSHVKGRGQSCCTSQLVASGPQPVFPAAKSSQRCKRQVPSPWKAMALSASGRSCAAVQQPCSSRGSRAGANLMSLACVPPSSEGRGQGGLAMTRERSRLCRQPEVQPRWEGGRVGGRKEGRG